jgi:hypothetical protein
VHQGREPRGIKYAAVEARTVSGRNTVSPQAVDEVDQAAVASLTWWQAGEHRRVCRADSSLSWMKSAVRSKMNWGQATTRAGWPAGARKRENLAGLYQLLGQQMLEALAGPSAHQTARQAK